MGWTTPSNAADRDEFPWDRQEPRGRDPEGDEESEWLAEFRRKLREDFRRARLADGESDK